MSYKTGLKGIDKFAQLFIRKVKDGQLQWLDLALEDRETDTGMPPTSPLYYKLMKLDEDIKNLIRATVTEATITGMHDFLYALEYIHNDGDDDIAVLVDGKNIVDLSEDGLHYDLFFWDEEYSDYFDSRKARELEVGKKPDKA